jgi:hypothetical protein
MKNPIHARLVQALLLVAGPLLASSGVAQNDSNDDWGPVKHLTFSADDIEGDLFTPEGERIETVLRATHPSLIELREGFEAEIAKTMEDM